MRFSAEVAGVARRGRDRVVDSGREDEPFTVHVRTAGGAEERIAARAVIDASGTWSAPNPLGGEGLPAVGERAAADRIAYRVPNLGDEAVRARYAGKHVVVAGSGHSALTALVALSGFVKESEDTRISWVLRHGSIGNTFGRAPTFLAQTGYEQVRSIAAHLAGDHDAAARVELRMAETGVCGGSGLFDEPDEATTGGCCAAPEPEMLTLSAPN